MQDLSQYPSQVPAIDWASSGPAQDNSVDHQAATGFAPSMIGESSLSASDPVDGMGAVLLENEELLTFFGTYASWIESRH